MTRREVKGLKNTGRVSVKRTQAASALIQKSAAKKGAHRLAAGETHVTVGRTAIGKNVVAFRVVGSHDEPAESAGSVESRTVNDARG